MAYYNYSKQLYFDTVLIEGPEKYVFINPTYVFYHQRI